MRWRRRNLEPEQTMIIGMDTSKGAAPDKDEREAVAAHIEALAQAQAPEIVAKSAEALILFKADHDADCAAYQFRCQRWGDFLSLMMNRQQPDATSWYRPPPEKTVVAVNLGESIGITFREGRTPDAFGEATFTPHVELGSHGWSANVLSPNGPALTWPKSGKWAVRATVPKLLPVRASIAVPVPPSKEGAIGHLSGYRDYMAKFKMPHARPAEDDVIEFANGVKVYAPAGLGQGVFDQIMAAIADGAQVQP